MKKAYAAAKETAIGGFRDLVRETRNYFGVGSFLVTSRAVAETPALFDFALFVQDVLAHSRIVLLNFHLLRMEAFVFGGRVEVTRPGRGVEPNLVSHPRSL